MIETEALARLIALHSEDSNCPNPAGHWDGSGGMPMYGEEHKEKCRAAARAALAAFADLRACIHPDCMPDYVEAVVVLAIHTSGFCGAEPADAGVVDWDCIEVANPVTQALREGLTAAID